MRSRSWLRSRVIIHDIRWKRETSPNYQLRKQQIYHQLKCYLIEYRARFDYPWKTNMPSDYGLMFAFTLSNNSSLDACSSGSRPRYRFTVKSAWALAITLFATTPRCNLTRGWAYLPHEATSWAHQTSNTLDLNGRPVSFVWLMYTGMRLMVELTSGWVGFGREHFTSPYAPYCGGGHKSDKPWINRLHK